MNEIVKQSIDGRKTAPAQVRVITKQEGRVVLEIVLHEGRNREIRKSNLCSKRRIHNFSH